MSTARRGNTPRWTFYPPRSAPKPLDIVWCWFPESINPGVPGPKDRPALVRTLQLNKDHTKAAVEVTYGTTNLKQGVRISDLFVANLSCIEASGLPSATRFDLDLTIVLPWCVEFFRPREGYVTPLIGHLDPNSCIQLEALKVAWRRMP